jgi:hypothetical protein
VDGDDVWVVESSDRLRFTLEALEALRVGSHLLGKHLQRHIAAERRVLGPIDHTHGPRAQLGGDLEVGEGTADQSAVIVTATRSSASCAHSRTNHSPLFRLTATPHYRHY